MQRAAEVTTRRYRIDKAALNAELGRIDAAFDALGQRIWRVKQLTYYDASTTAAKAARRRSGHRGGRRRARGADGRFIAEAEVKAEANPQPNPTTTLGTTRGAKREQNGQGEALERGVNAVEWASHRDMKLGSRRRLRDGDPQGEAAGRAADDDEQPRMGWRKRLKAAEGRLEKEKVRREKAEKALAEMRRAEELRVIAGAQELVERRAAEQRLIRVSGAVCSGEAHVVERGCDVVSGCAVVEDRVEELRREVFHLKQQLEEAGEEARLTVGLLAEETESQMEAEAEVQRLQVELGVAREEARVAGVKLLEAQGTSQREVEDELRAARKGYSRFG